MSNKYTNKQADIKHDKQQKTNMEVDITDLSTVIK
jgi:hypothetical protein